MTDLSLTDPKFWILIATQIAGFIFICIKLYAKSYSGEKGKNLATKEDIGEITQIVESIKTSLSIKTEELKSDLSFKNEHLIHLRAAERAAIINYYKAVGVLVLSLSKPDLIKYEIDNFDDKHGIADNSKTIKYISDTEKILNKIQEDMYSLKYQKDISESELMFFYNDPEITSIIDKLNLSLLEFEKALYKSINLLLQVFDETTAKINTDQVAKDVIIEAKRKRSDLLANWYEDRRDNFMIIRTFNENLKSLLLKRLKSLTS